MLPDPDAPPRPLPDRPTGISRTRPRPCEAGAARSITDAQFKIARSWISELAEAQGLRRFT
jgi:hypothetical protein